MAVKSIWPRAIDDDDRQQQRQKQSAHYTDDDGGGGRARGEDECRVSTSSRCARVEVMLVVSGIKIVTTLLMLLYA